MKLALIKSKPQKSNYQQEINNNQQQGEDRETKTEKKEIRINTGTHLTVSGVCTTIRPENSGT
jgi:hypothetical protein